LANTAHEPAAAPLTADCFAIACRAMDDMVLLAHIREQHKLSLQSYGRPRMAEELQELGFDVSNHRVGRLMCQNGIKAFRTRKHIPLGYVDMPCQSAGDYGQQSQL